MGGVNGEENSLHWKANTEYYDSVVESKYVNRFFGEILSFQLSAFKGIIFPSYTEGSLTLIKLIHKFTLSLYLFIYIMSIGLDYVWLG